MLTKQQCIHIEPTVLSDQSTPLMTLQLHICAANVDLSTVPTQIGWRLQISKSTIYFLMPYLNIKHHSIP